MAATIVMFGAAFYVVVGSKEDKERRRAGARRVIGWAVGAVFASWVIGGIVYAVTNDGSPLSRDVCHIDPTICEPDPDRVIPDR